MPFSKIFESEKYGQILVKKDINGEEKPEIRFYVEPENLGICSIAMAFNSDEKIDQAFNSIDLDFSEKIVGKAFQDIFSSFSKIVK